MVGPQCRRWTGSGRSGSRNGTGRIRRRVLVVVIMTKKMVTGGIRAIVVSDRHRRRH
jgi:hypothetical protein